MKILLTGATGYIAQKLLPLLLENGHDVICCVRDRARVETGKFRSTQLSVFHALIRLYDYYGYRPIVSYRKWN